MSRRPPAPPQSSEKYAAFSDRVLGIAVIKGSWNAAQKYLLETGNFSEFGAYTAVRMVEKQNPDIKLPWGDTI
jgi:hypothetical protein